MSRPARLSQASRDGLLIAASWLTLVLGFGLGLKPLTTAFFVGIAPLAAFVFAGHFVGRGAAVAGLILTLGVGFLKIGAGFSLTDCVILGILAGGALTGGLIAEGMTPTRLPSVGNAGATAQGGWMTVVVETREDFSTAIDPNRAAGPHFGRERIPVGTRRSGEPAQARADATV